MRLDPAPTHSFGALPERDAVEDFGNHLGGLGDRHSGTVEEQIAVSKREPRRLALLPCEHALNPRFPPAILLSLTTSQVLRRPPEG
jgi:hypothetical protein